MSIPYGRIIRQTSHILIIYINRKKKKKMYGFYYWPLGKENGSFKTLEIPEAESQLRMIMEVFLLEQWLSIVKAV